MAAESGSGSLTISASRLPSGDQAYSKTPPGQVGDPLGLSSAAIEQPDLIHLARIVPVGKKCQVPAVGAPAGRVLAGLAGGQPNASAALPAHHPDVAVVLVLGGIGHGHGVGHPGTVGRDLRDRSPRAGGRCRPASAFAVPVSCAERRVSHQNDASDSHHALLSITRISAKAHQHSNKSSRVTSTAWTSAPAAHGAL